MAESATFVEFVNLNTMPCPMYKFIYPISQNDDIIRIGDGRTKIYPDEQISDKVVDWIKWTQQKFNTW